jgi:uncharacterized protein YyaL (SSP411 family)
LPLPDANLLGDATSPYLLQHAGNPVHWRPWSTAAFAEARERRKPILLSIGYAACHWCHVMAHESFEDADVAAVMNELFVNIKVDREERPDIDRIYMTALLAFTDHGGWPMTLFLDADGAPFWGGTYFPKVPRRGMPGFVDVLRAVARVHGEEPERIAANADAVRHHLADHAAITTADRPLDRDLLDRTAHDLLRRFDPRWGGLLGAPKFPQTNLLDLLWRVGLRGADDALSAVLTTLDRMSRGGIYDHLGGGYARYSTDETWSVPHFEKMLSDNAQILELLGRAWSATGQPMFRERIEETVAWLDRETTVAGGAFASSIDADSEHREGAFYVWSHAELQEILGADFPLFAEAYDIRPAGNWEGVSIPNRNGDSRPRDEARERRLAELRALLLERRSQRPRPITDDKVLADWNGAAITALTLVARRLDRPDWLDRARRAYRFIAESMTVGDRLGHSWRDGRLLFPGFSADYAHMIRAAVTLYETSREPAFLADAIRWADALDRHHADPDGGWYQTADDAEPLLVRPRALHDDAVPNPTAVAVDALLRLAVLTGDDRRREIAETALDRLAGVVRGEPRASASLLAAFDTAIDLVEVVVIVPPGGDPTPMRRVVFESIDPRIVLFETESIEGLPAMHPAASRSSIDGAVTAWVCRDHACGLPITDPATLAAALDTQRPA